MYKYKTLAALVATMLLATVGAASAQTVTGGGASLPADLYKGCLLYTSPSPRDS